MLWQAATEDAAANVEETSVYVARVHHGLKAFISSDELCDREGTISELTRLMSDVGQFVEVVGAKNQGKSHIALALVKQLNAGGKHHAIIVNARVACVSVCSVEGSRREPRRHTSMGMRKQAKPTPLL